MPSTHTAEARQPGAAAAPLVPPAPGSVVDGRAAALATPPTDTAAAVASCARLQAATARELRLLVAELASDATDLQARAHAARLAHEQQRATITGVGAGILGLLGPQSVADDVPALAAERHTISPRSYTWRP
jgi:hypothetical protein